MTAFFTTFFSARNVDKNGLIVASFVELFTYPDFTVCTALNYLHIQQAEQKGESKFWHD
jgi:hypothetical protein